MQIVDDTLPIPRRAKVSLRIELVNQLRPGDAQSSKLRCARLGDAVDMRLDRVGNGAIGATLRVRNTCHMQQTDTNQEPMHSLHQNSVASRRKEKHQVCYP
jgi:hypothetical protein